MRDLKVRVSIGLLILGDFNKIKECLNINVQFPLGNLSYMSCCCQVYLTLSAELFVLGIFHFSGFVVIGLSRHSE